MTLVDNRLVTEEALSANFLIPPDEGVFGGKTVAELCCDSLKDFNPMVRVSALKGIKQCSRSYRHYMLLRSVLSAFLSLMVVTKFHPRAL